MAAMSAYEAIEKLRAAGITLPEVDALFVDGRTGERRNYISDEAAEYGCEAAAAALAEALLRYKRVVNHVQWYPDDAYKLCYTGGKALSFIMDRCTCTDRSTLSEEEDKRYMQEHCPANDMPADWD